MDVEPGRVAEGTEENGRDHLCPYWADEPVWDQQGYKAPATTRIWATQLRACVPFQIRGKSRPQSESPANGDLTPNRRLQDPRRYGAQHKPFVHLGITPVLEPILSKVQAAAALWMLKYI